VRQLKPKDKIRLSAFGLAANPDLAGQTGTVTNTDGGVVEAVWDGRTVWLRESYVEVCDDVA
jgi:hypothetical protein